MIESGNLPEEVTTPPQSPGHTMDSDGNLKVMLGANSWVLLHELDGYESIKADTMISGAMNPLVILKLYTIFAVSRLFRNGVEEKLVPIGKADVEVWARAKKFTGRELTLMMASYADAFMGSPVDGEELKNLSTPPHE